jgi:hypothetical protein
MPPEQENLKRAPSPLQKNTVVVDHHLFGSFVPPIARSNRISPAIAKGRSTIIVSFVERLGVKPIENWKPARLL